MKCLAATKVKKKLGKNNVALHCENFIGAANQGMG